MSSQWQQGVSGCITQKCLPPSVGSLPPERACGKCCQSIFIFALLTLIYTLKVRKTRSDNAAPAQRSPNFTFGYNMVSVEASIPSLFLQGCGALRLSKYACSYQHDRYFLQCMQFDIAISKYLRCIGLLSCDEDSGL